MRRSSASIRFSGSVLAGADMTEVVATIGTELADSLTRTFGDASIRPLVYTLARLSTFSYKIRLKSRSKVNDKLVISRYFATIDGEHVTV